MRDYIVSAILSRHPGAVVETRQWDGGLSIEVRLKGQRPVRVSCEWGDNPETIVAYLLDHLTPPGLAM